MLNQISVALTKSYPYKKRQTRSKNMTKENTE